LKNLNPTFIANLLWLRSGPSESTLSPSHERLLFFIFLPFFFFFFSNKSLDLLQLSIWKNKKLNERCLLSITSQLSPTKKEKIRLNPNFMASVSLILPHCQSHLLQPRVLFLPRYMLLSSYSTELEEWYMHNKNVHNKTHG
jgi:hypothetical protein